MKEFLKAVVYETSILVLSLLAVLIICSVGLWKPWLFIVAVCTWALSWFIEQLFLEHEEKHKNE